MPKNITVDCTNKVKKEGFFDVQNVPPLTPFRAVKLDKFIPPPTLNHYQKQGKQLPRLQQLPLKK